MYVNSKGAGYPCLSLDTNQSSLARWNCLSQLSPSWPLKQTETSLPHNWMLLAVLWLILIFFFLRLNVIVIGEAEFHTSQKGWSYRIRILLVCMAPHSSMVNTLSHRPAVMEMVTLWRVSPPQIAECTYQHCLKQKKWWISSISCFSNAVQRRGGMHITSH